MQLHLVAGIRSAQMSITKVMCRSAPSTYIRSEEIKHKGKWRRLRFQQNVFCTSESFLPFKAKADILLGR